MHYHSPRDAPALQTSTATPESLIEQLGRKEVFVAEDVGRIVATGGLGWLDPDYRPWR